MPVNPSDFGGIPVEGPKKGKVNPADFGGVPVEQVSRREPFGDLEAVKRGIGLKGRQAIESVSDVVGLVSNPIRWGSNVLFGTKLPTFTGQVSQQLTSMGFPQEQGPVESGFGTASRMLLGATLPIPSARPIGPLVRSVPGRVESAEDLIKLGAQPTPGQIAGGAVKSIEEKAQSLPITGIGISSAQRGAVESFNIAALNRVLSRIGDRIPEGTQAGSPALDYAEGSIREAYSKALEGVTLSKGTFFDRGMEKLKESAKLLSPAQRAQFDNVVDNVVERRFEGQSMSADRFKESVGEVGRLARNRSGDPSADTRELGSLLERLRNHLNVTVRRQNPKKAVAIRDADRAYRDWVRVEIAATRPGAREGVFTPSGLLASVRQSDKSLRKGSFRRGTVPLEDIAKTAQRVMGDRYPDSGTAGRVLTASLLAGAISPKVLVADLVAYGIYRGGIKTLADAYIRDPRTETLRRIASSVARVSPKAAASIAILNTQRQTAQ